MQKNKKTVWTINIICVCVVGILSLRLIHYKKEAKMVELARQKCIEYNMQHKKWMNNCIVEYYNGDASFETALTLIKLQMPMIIKIEESLGIDCIMYEENGKPYVAKDDQGKLQNMYDLPNELRLQGNKYRCFGDTEE